MEESDVEAYDARGRVNVNVEFSGYILAMSIVGWR